ncbi:hypothetical protein GHT06_012990 [Daphnia sinensis]|uniref:Bromo domain-containing protein n=1 Tax=Daphnia sinensis TaxID=1820382 RepID=A0AAD5LHB8_9CRUS|nr:hypothetical protein GHT06_012990 [Daphnia sinensis]
MASSDKISSQQKLKMKMVSIDTWSVREQLCLASSVLRSGDQNWVSVSRSLKLFAEPNRPQDWLSPRNCALQYNSLLEKTGAHKRKRGERHPSSGSTDSLQGETAGEIILRQLTQERIEELQQLLESSRREYQKLKKELDLVQEGKLDDRLPEISKQIDEENEKKLNEQKSHQKWLQERESKQQELKQAQQLMLRSPTKTSNSSEAVDGEMATGSPSVTDQLNIDVSTDEVRETTIASPSEAKQGSTGGSITPVVPAATPSSPLLTSLLRSPTATASVPPNATKGFTTPPSKPFTLTSPSGLSPGLKNLVSTAIGEDTSAIKVASTSPGTRVAAPTLTHLLELPLNSPGKPLPDLTVSEETEVSTVSITNKNEVQTKSQEVETEKMEETSVPENEEQVVLEETVEASDVTIVRTEKESCAMETEEPKPSAEKETPNLTETAEPVVKKEAEPVSKAEDNIEPTVKDEQPDVTVAFESEIEVSHTEDVEKTVEEMAADVTPTVGDMKSEPVEEEEVVHEEEEKVVEEVNEESADEKVEEKQQKTVEAETTSKSETETPKTTRRAQRGSRKKEIASEAEGTPSDEKTKPSELGPTTRRSSGRKGPQSDDQETEVAEEQPETIVPTGVGKKKTTLPPPLYVPSASPAPSSGIDSTPNSPTSSVSTVAEDDRDYRTWKKSILLVWREISSHKNASLFAKPITEESVPGYRSLVMRPMDLSTIKKNIESGAIRSTVEFQRDISLMFFNSIIYNPTYHEVNRLAKEMYTESTTIIQEFVNAQLLAAHNVESIRPVRRETRDLARRTESLSSHEETPVKLEEGKTRAAKRASAAAQIDDSTTIKTKRRSRLHND